MKCTYSWFFLSVFFLFLLGGCTAPVISPTATQAPLPTSTSAQTLEAPSSETPTELPAKFLFEDFEYQDHEEMTANGWIMRAKAGWPGIPGATFRPENISFVEDTEVPNNHLLRMTSSTDGTSANTSQAQVCHQRKYLEGTYAARVYFTNEPSVGPDGDQVVETFYAITPYEEPLKPEYSETDFEYLPNGGWSWEPMSFMFVTWEAVRIEPWLADNTYDFIVEDQEGWRTLVLQVRDARTRYYVNGRMMAEHSGNYYPDSPMSINFNLWFVNGGLLENHEPRSYQEDIDWVFHQADVILTPEQVDQQVRALREAGTRFQDTVPAAVPSLESLCDL